MQPVFQSISTLAGGALAIYLLGRLFSSRNEILACCTAVIIVLAARTLLFTPVPGQLAAEEWLSSSQDFLMFGDSFWPGEAASRLIAAIALALGFLVSIFSATYLELDRRYKTYYPLLLLTIAGLVGMVYARDLFLLYLFLEWMSVCAYVLVAFRRNTNTAIEAGFKYLIMGSSGTILFLLGLAWIYRDTGQIIIPQQAWTAGLWARAGLVCALIGLGIKSALVPLHTWLPDAHGRAPSSISAMLSGILIQGCFFVWLRVALGMGIPPATVGIVLLFLSFANMITGNLMALVQTHVKRLLAFSSIAQMGYIMFSFGIGLRFGLPQAIQAGFIYIAIHAALKSLAFLSKGVCHFYCHTTTLKEMQGIARQLPLPALTMTIALAGLSGLPPLAGFSGKWFILATALDTNHPLALAGTVLFLTNSLVSLGYYLPFIVLLFTQPSAHAGRTLRLQPSVWVILPLVIISSLILAASFYPSPWIHWLAPPAVWLSGG